ncbi:hypothetical protein PRIPAC_72343 [Pristionchus pacificus]|uniref:Zinc finger protein n=1 Tax=Pristionchus pacificus TaxID=54126 RepID=A0A2A6CRF0_PRIPA|nr:hypothetical protein PRIPAC_72343 [Pristionchus pacificus]|eukprot:PDM80623.1 zinc finger protein [Pristionchus pacificus]
MSIACVATHRRRTTFTEEYLRMADQSAGSGHIKSKSRNGFDVFINFTDPHRVMCGQPNSSIQYFMASRGDLNHGFPHNQTLTNFIQWQQYYICFSDGLIWTINAFTKAWNVVTVRNSDDFEWQPNSRHDFLHTEDDRMTLVKFLPNRANCERVILHEYTLFVHNDNHLNTEVHTPITSSRSGRHPSEISQSTTSSTNASHNSSFSQSHGSIDSTTPIFSTQSSPSASEPLLEPENDDISECSTGQSATALESSDKSDDKSNYLSCKICLIEYGNRARSAIVPCGHLACSNCIRQSMKENNRCPFCRKNIECTLRIYE